MKSAALSPGVVFRTALTLGLIGLLVWTVDLKDAFQKLAHADPLWVLAAIAVAAADRALMIGKWIPLIRVQIPNISIGLATRACLVSFFASVFLPASVGADVLRAWIVGRNEGRVAEAGASIVLERVLGVAAIGVFCVLALAMATGVGEFAELIPWAIAVAVLSVAGVLLPLTARGAAVLRQFVGSERGQSVSFLRRLAHAYLAYSARPMPVLVCAVLTLIEQLFPIAIFWLLALALETPVTLSMLFVAVPLMLFVQRLPIAIGGIGVGEVGMVYLLGLLGTGAEDALALALGARFVDLLVLLPGGFFWVSPGAMGEAEIDRAGRA